MAGAYDVMHSPYLRHAGTPGMSNRFQKLTIVEERLREDNRQYLRHVLGSDNFNRNYSTGGRLTFDEAVALALREPSNPGTDNRVSTRAIDVIAPPAPMTRRTVWPT